MTYALTALILAYAITVWVFVRALSEAHTRVQKDRIAQDNRFEQERIEWRKERQTLLNRIQHPEFTPPESLPLSDGVPKHISIEDDKALLEYREGAS